MSTSGQFKTKSNFLEDLKNRILTDNKNEPCELCGIYHSVGQVQVTDEKDQSSQDLFLCKDCYVDIKHKKDDNLMLIYSLSQVVK